MNDNKPATAPFYSKDQLEYLADQHTAAFSRYDGKEDPGFSAWKFAAYYLGKEVRFEWLSNNGGILGLSSFTAGTRVAIYLPEENNFEWQELGPDTILLNKLFEDAFLNPGRARFTLMHECAHHLLHTPYYQRITAAQGKTAVAYSIQYDRDQEMLEGMNAWTDYDRMEWQANYLASALLMPEKRVSLVLEKKGYKDAYFDQVMAGYAESTAYNQLISRLAGAFRVSPIVAKIRLDKRGFERLPDLRKPKPNPWSDWIPPPQKPVRMSKEERRLERMEKTLEKRRNKEKGL
ncbi:MAG: ImmA/IrrE family metallo-endopeptidase [Eubacteriales bacterium]|nr:ImmA/IrrE family metallo-endopeptidase [Eubacteriales bacterium]